MRFLSTRGPQAYSEVRKAAWSSSSSPPPKSRVQKSLRKIHPLPQNIQLVVAWLVSVLRDAATAALVVAGRVFVGLELGVGQVASYFSFSEIMTSPLLLSRSIIA